MFRKIQEAKDYPCHGCEKEDFSKACRFCKEWQDCFRKEWYKMRVDFNKLKRGEKIV